ncbi:ATP-dependent DNA helicase DDX11 isoform X2 [Uranotaenia lowii]|nr:ATP-dependent DNA helicase DDX11 isoform X2 [Uranotaenia lowii]
MGFKKQLVELKGTKDLMDEYNKRLLELKQKTLKVKKKRRFDSAKVKDKVDEQLSKGEVEKMALEDGDDYMVQDSDDDDEDIETGEEDKTLKYKPIQVIFCSRTHSQLGQVVNEIRRTEFGKWVRLTSLASRQNFCINPEVRKLRTNALINERCLELQKNKGKATVVDEIKKAKKKRKVVDKCPFYNKQAVEDLKNDALFEVQDIEELVMFAKQEQACPYYASRAAIPDSQLLMVPYQNLLHHKTREQTGIDIKNSVIIIDEAHNLLDTIAAIHSQEISAEVLEQARLHLNAYKTQYFARFSTKNLLKINQLLFVATRLCKLLHLQGGDKSSTSRMISPIDFLTEADIFNLNIQELLEFADKSRIAQKVHGFVQSCPHALERDEVKPRPKTKTLTTTKNFLKQLEKDVVTDEKKSAKKAEVEDSKEHPLLEDSTPQKPLVNAIRPLLSFLECLAEDFDDGRVLLSFDGKEPKRSSMKYLLLNPGARFEEILNNCRALVLAGGTMQPVEELTEQLFKGCPDRVVIKSYRHVVPPDAVLPLAVARGPGGNELLFNFANRQKKELLNEITSTLMNVCHAVPNGIVAFFASYDYLELFYANLKESGRLAALEERKRIFKEPRGGGAACVEKMLSEYARAARGHCSGKQTGALMLSVVGGKLSEGLNFSDELGRCVVVVGLPYPNRNSPELMERMRFLDRSLGPTAGNEYYENLCMKAVNQCIGRAVRHIRDYASVVLLDARYCSNEKVQKKLPSWISEGLQSASRYGQAQGSLIKFFKNKAAKNESQ